jgi:hypothetical protein
MARIEFFDTYDMSYLNDAVEEAACNHAPGDLIPGDARIPDLTESQWESLIFAMAGDQDLEIRFSRLVSIARIELRRQQGTT